MDDIVIWIREHPEIFIISILASLTATLIASFFKYLVRFIKNFFTRKPESRCLLSRTRFFKNLEYQYMKIPFVKSREEQFINSDGEHRFEPLKRLRLMLKQKNCLLVVVGGSGGLGKSRLCYELSRKNSSVYFVNWQGYHGISDNFKSFCQKMVGEDLKNKILVYEDAHEQITLFLEFLKAVRPLVKRVVVTTRYPHELGEALKKHKLYTEYRLILGTLTDAAAILPSPKEDWFTPQLRLQIGTIAEGIPQLAVEGFNYLERQSEEGKNPEQCLQSIHTSLQLLDTLVKDIERKTGTGNSFLAAQLALIRTVPETHRIVSDPDHFEAICYLQELGYLRRSEKVLRFTPDILADHLVLRCFFCNNRRHPEYDSLIRSVSPDLVLPILRTLSVLETERDRSFFTGVIDTTLQHLRNRRDLSPGDRVSIGLDAFEIIQKFHRLEANYGPFWEYGKKLKDAHKIIQLAVFLHRSGSWQAAESLWKKSYKVFKKGGDALGMANTLNNLGLLYDSRGDWDRAIEFYHKSLEAFEKLGDQHGVAKTWGNLGNVNYSKCDWDRAIEFYYKSLEAFEKLSDRHGKAQTWGNLGNVYKDKGEEDRAIKFYHKSLELKEKLGDRHGMASTFNNLGLIYQHAKGDLNRAIEFYRKSQELNKKLGDRHGMAQTWGNLGWVLFEKGEHKEGIRLVDLAIHMFKKIGAGVDEELGQEVMEGFRDKLGQMRYEIILKEVRDERKADNSALIMI